MEKKNMNIDIRVMAGKWSHVTGEIRSVYHSQGFLLTARINTESYAIYITFLKQSQMARNGIIRNLCSL